MEQVRRILTDIRQKLKTTFCENNAEEYIEAYEQYYKLSEAPLELSQSHEVEPIQAGNVQEKLPLIKLARKRSELTEQEKRKAHSELLKDLYKNLDTLDGKAAGLLTYCGLFLAGSMFLLNWDVTANELSRFFVLFIALGAAVSAFLALSVVFIVWTSIENLSHRSNFEACKHFYEVRQARTKTYTLSWLAIALSTILLFLYLGLETAMLIRADIGDMKTQTEIHNEDLDLPAAPEQDSPTK